MTLGEIPAGVAAVGGAISLVHDLNNWLSGAAFAWPKCNSIVMTERNACHFLKAEFFMVIEKWTGNVRIYPYLNRNDANEAMDYGFFGFMFPSRVLFSVGGEELAANGPGFAHNTIRKSFRFWLKNEVEQLVNSARLQEHDQ